MTLCTQGNGTRSTVVNSPAYLCLLLLSLIIQQMIKIPCVCQYPHQGSRHYEVVFSQFSEMLPQCFDSSSPRSVCYSSAQPANTIRAHPLSFILIINHNPPG